MATTNIWQKFRGLLPSGMRVIVTIKSIYPNGTAQAYLRNGSVIIVQGEGLEIGQRYFAVDRKVQSVAPALDYFEVEV